MSRNTDDADLVQPVYCPQCRRPVSEHADYCPHCGNPVSLSARRQQEETARTGRSAEDQPAEIEAQEEGGTVQQQVIVQRDQSWWIIAAIVGVPVGCIVLIVLLPALLLGGILLGTYGLPFLIGVGVAVWIWYKHPGSRQVRIRWAIIALALGAAGTVLLFVGVIVASTAAG